MIQIRDPGLADNSDISKDYVTQYPFNQYRGFKIFNKLFCFPFKV